MRGGYIRTLSSLNREAFRDFRSRLALPRRALLISAGFSKKGSEKPSSIGEADGFATFYILQSDEHSASSTTLSLPGYPRSNGDHLLASETGIIFLEGYQSAQHLIDLGAAYKMDPEFYQRHLRFLIPLLTKNEFSKLQYCRCQSRQLATIKRHSADLWPRSVYALQARWTST